MNKKPSRYTRRVFLPLLFGMAVALPAFAKPTKTKQKKKKKKQQAPEGDPITDATKLYEKGDFQGVVDKLMPHAKDDPPLPGCQRLLGLSHHQLGEHAKAVGELKAALQAEPRNQDMLFALAVSQGKTGDHTSKVNSLKQLLGVNPKHAYAHYEMGIACNELGKMDLVVHHFQEFLALAPNAPEADKVRSILAQLGY